MVERERISALMDGELTDDEFAGRIQQLRTEEGAEDWRTYHLIGDVLRGDSMFSSGFAQKVQAALASEPTVLAPAPLRKPGHAFQRYAMAAAASVAGIAVVGWFALVNHEAGKVDVADGNPPATVAPPVASSRAAIAQGDGAVGEYLRAHQEVSPTAELHGLAAYIRTVSTQDDADGQ